MTHHGYISVIIPPANARRNDGAVNGKNVSVQYVI